MDLIKGIGRVAKPGIPLMFCELKTGDSTSKSYWDLNGLPEFVTFLPHPLSKAPLRPVGMQFRVEPEKRMRMVTLASSFRAALLCPPRTSNLRSGTKSEYFAGIWFHNSASATVGSKLN